MIGLFKQRYTVHDIHVEVDSAQDRFLQSADSLLKELNMVTESHIEKKANLLKSMGFINSETVKKAEEIKKSVKDVKDRYEMTAEKAKLINDYRLHYPLEKFIPIEEFNRICEKYDLKHAPAKFYIKDIPEKNVLEMSKRKPLQEIHNVTRVKYLKVTDFYYHTPADLKAIFVNKEHKIPNFMLPSINRYGLNGLNTANMITFARQLGYTGDFNNYFSSSAKITEIDESGIRVAAPISHFNIENLRKTSKFGFNFVTETKIDDPIAFEFCKGDIVRILSKWGTPDDQSYLDPALTNEVYN
jgi:hypothetical protein